jgi:hypothetical protein
MHIAIVKLTTELDRLAFSVLRHAIKRYNAEHLASTITARRVTTEAGRQVTYLQLTSDVPACVVMARLGALYGILEWREID